MSRMLEIMMKHMHDQVESRDLWKVKCTGAGPEELGLRKGET